MQGIQMICNHSVRGIFSKRCLTCELWTPDEDESPPNSEVRETELIDEDPVPESGIEERDSDDE